MTTNRYYLPQHVFICHCGKCIVVLDLKHHRYRALDSDQTSCLSAVVPGWPVISKDVGDATGDDMCNAVAQDLVKRGILSDDSVAGKSADPVSISSPVKQLIVDDDGTNAPMRIGAVAALLIAFIVSAYQKRCWSIEKIVHWVGAHHRNRRSDVLPIDVDQTRDLLRIYTRIRPILFRSSNACLFETLVLRNYLLKYGIRADWVFGVRVKPWLAHCWLQSNGIVLNDTIEHVSFFTPIMVVS